jgi:hypothetical protein
LDVSADDAIMPPEGIPAEGAVMPKSIKHPRDLREHMDAVAAGAQPRKQSIQDDPFPAEGTKDSSVPAWPCWMNIYSSELVIRYMSLRTFGSSIAMF